MNNFKVLSYISLLLVFIFAMTGCDTKLKVENLNEPDTERALASPADLEALVGGSFLNIFEVMEKSFPGMGLSTAGDEITSSWGNWHMRNASWEPRFAFDNSPSYRYSNFTETPWYNSYAAISSVNDGLRAIAEGMHFYEVNGADTTDNTMRAKAYCKFIQGISHGFLALFFDQAFIFDETVDLATQTLDLKPYNEVLDAAVAMLEEAIAVCETNTFTAPNTWINGYEFSNVQLAQLCHSYIARFLAWVGRTPAERAAADWHKIINHAQKGITEDFLVYGDGDIWWSRLQGHTQDPNWCRVDNNALGPADTSGNYQQWLATPLEDRMHFIIFTPDLRITSGDSIGTGVFDHIGTDFDYAGYPRHRPDRGAYHFSAYVFKRYKAHLDNGLAGDITLFKTTELDLLIAEGLLRTGGDPGQVAELINRTRVNRGGLPPATAADAIGSPDDPHGILASASLWSKLKHEKFIENFCVTAGTGYFERRGWGELITGTPLHWPVPGKELEILLKEIYTHGGTTGNYAPKTKMPEFDDIYASYE